MALPRKAGSPMGALEKQRPVSCPTVAIAETGRRFNMPIKSPPGRCRVSKTRSPRPRLRPEPAAQPSIIEASAALPAAGHNVAASVTRDPGAAACSTLIETLLPNWRSVAAGTAQHWEHARPGRQDDRLAYVGVSVT